MKNKNTDSTSNLSRFARDKRQRLNSSERVERSPRPRREADNEGQKEFRPRVAKTEKRTSFNPHFTADNRLRPEYEQRPRRNDEGDRPQRSNVRGDRNADHSFGRGERNTSERTFNRGERTERNFNRSDRNDRPAADRSFGRGERTEGASRGRSEGGFKAKGGATVDLVWKDGRPVNMTITGGWEECVQIEIPEGMTATVKGCEHEYCDDFVQLNMSQGKKAEIRFRAV